MVSLRSYLSPQHVVLDLDGRSKTELLQGAGSHLAALVDGLDAGEITGLLAAREHLASTGVGLGIAIPHASSAALSEPCLALYRTRQPVPFDSVDGVPVNLMLVVLAPQSSQALHLRLLARVARLVRADHVRKRLLEVPSAEEAIQFIGEVEGSL
jgi:nitrogen PTS system EIIA component